MLYIKKDILAALVRTFRERQFSHAKQQAEDLLCDVLGCSRMELYSDEQQLLSEKERVTLQDWVGRRLEGEPLAYLSGRVEFYGCLIEVNRTVLIPRPETEILVDKVISALKKEDLKNKVLWDLCCGSGCIGISLKKRFPDLTVYVSDCSETAIALTRRNAEANGVDVISLQGDLLAPFLGSRADYLVCNPPYISECEYAMLDREVKDYEPRLALVGGETGMEMYARLAEGLPGYLYPRAHVWLEIGHQQGEAVKKLFQSPYWKKSEVEQDWAGHDRFFFVESQ